MAEVLRINLSTHDSASSRDYRETEEYLYLRAKSHSSSPTIYKRSAMSTKTVGWCYSCDYSKAQFGSSLIMAPRITKLLLNVPYKQLRIDMQLSFYAEETSNEEKKRVEVAKICEDSNAIRSWMVLDTYEIISPQRYDSTYCCELYWINIKIEINRKIQMSRGTKLERHTVECIWSIEDNFEMLRQIRISHYVMSWFN